MMDLPILQGQKSQLGLSEPCYEKTLFMPYANNKDADHWEQPAHRCSLISVFVIHMLYSITHIDVIFKISRLQLGSIAEQAGLSLTW